MRTRIARIASFGLLRHSQRTSAEPQPRWDQATVLAEHRKRCKAEVPVGADGGLHLSATSLLEVNTAAAFGKAPSSALVHSVGALGTPAAAVQLQVGQVVVPMCLHRHDRNWQPRRYTPIVQQEKCDGHGHACSL